MLKRVVLCGISSVCLVVLPAAAMAQVIAPAGYIYVPQLLTDTTQSCVASGPSGTFVGLGPGFTGGAQSVVFVTASGSERVVASGFNSIGDCAWDHSSDTLYVTDNALEAPGAVTGDTVFALPHASRASGLSALGNELAPAGSIAGAAGVAVAVDGSIFVSDAAGGGNGSVKLVSSSGLSDFIAGGFDFTGGLVVDSDGTLVVAETTDAFASLISRFDSGGNFMEVVSGPTFDHGSYDLDFDIDGNLLVSGAFGGDVVALGPGGSASRFVGGLTFATGLSLDGFTGKVSILSSTFSGADEDSSVHGFIPVSRLVPGRGKPDRNCFGEFYGIRLVPRKPGAAARHAICSDGAACDADGKINDSCLFPFGVCINVVDSRLPGCAPQGVAALSVKMKPESPAMDALVADIASVLPAHQERCFLGDGVSVPLKITRSGKRRKGKARIRIGFFSDSSPSKKDVDKVKLQCVPTS